MSMINDPRVADAYTLLQKIVENNAAKCPYVVTIYCNLDNTRPRVYHELVGVMDLWTCDPWKMRKWINAMNKARYNFPNAVETGEDPVRGTWFKFKDIPAMPYVFKAWPIRDLVRYPGWFDLAQEVPLGCNGDLGNLVCQEGWPKLSQLANAAAREQFFAEWGEYPPGPSYYR